MPVSKACTFTLSFKKLLNHSPTENTLCRGPTQCSRLNSNILIPDTIYFNFVSVQFSRSVMSDSTIPWTAARQTSLSFTTSRSLLKLMSIESVILSNHLILSSPSPPAFNLSQHQGLFNWVSSSHQVAKVLEFQLQHQSFQWIISVDCFRIDWFDLLAVQETLKSLLQYHGSKVSILQHSAFFMVQLSHPYMITGKNHSFD